MKTALPVIVLLVLSAALSPAEKVVAQKVVAQQPIEFQNHIIPVLTKNGCNAGACHGAAIGRGGFKLSLYGSNPEADYLAIARQLQGRRVNVVRPRESLLLLKPTEQLEHGGGQVFDLDSPSAERISSWIKQGAKFQSTRRLARVEVSPQKHIAETVGETIKLKAVANFSDGTETDVTRWTIFSAEDPSAVNIHAVTASATIQRRGRHVVVARYLSEVVPIEILVPLTDLRSQTTTQQNLSFIDREINATLRTLRIPPAPIADDETFRRRITLDLTGRLPEVTSVATELDRDALIDELLQSEPFNQYWTYWLAKLLRVHPQVNDQTGATTYWRWLSDQVAADRSYQQIASDLITATGDSHQSGPANFYRTVGGPREQAEFFSELFMGSRLRCANCHNHPLDRWTQDDYHGLAAIFAKVQSGKIVRDKPDGEVIHPRTGLPAQERIPGEDEFADADSGGREALAVWTTDSHNPYFAKAIVNRLWKHMMGRGLVEPVDDFRDTNPPTHPVLLDQLASDFVAHDYSIRHTLRVIARSAAYSRSADANQQNKDDIQFYSRASRRSLDPEVLADVVSDVLGVAEKYGDQPIGTRAVSLIDPKTPSRTLDVLGRCGGEESCETDSASGSLPQKLHLFNGGLLNNRIAAEGGRLQKWIDDGKTPMEIVIGFYRQALGRPPSNEERSHWHGIIDGLKTKEEHIAFLSDFVWGMMTCEEFTTNH